MMEIRLPHIPFDTGSGLTANSIGALEGAAVTLQRYPEMNVVVEGHTDNSSPTTENMRVSKRRAMVVADFLVERGVDRCRLQAIGYGGERPVADNENEQGRRRNNRVSLSIASGDGTFADFPQFTPWPPPKPTSSVQLSADFFADDGNLRDAADRLALKLQEARHEYKFYGVPACGGCGFALATRLERFSEDDGSPIPDSLVHAMGDQSPDTFASWLKGLFQAPTGFYRFIIFVVIDVDRMPDEYPRKASAAEAEEYLSGGKTAVPEQFSRCGFAGKNIEALVYEFTKTGREEAEIVAPSRGLSGYTHIQMLGLSQLLAAPR